MVTARPVPGSGSGAGCPAASTYTRPPDPDGTRYKTRIAGSPSTRASAASRCSAGAARPPSSTTRSPTAPRPSRVRSRPIRNPNGSAAAAIDPSLLTRRPGAPPSNPAPASSCSAYHTPVGTLAHSTGASTLRPGGVARRQWLITVPISSATTTTVTTAVTRPISSLRCWFPSTPNTLWPQGGTGCQVSVLASVESTYHA